MSHSISIRTFLRPDSSGASIRWTEIELSDLREIPPIVERTVGLLNESGYSPRDIFSVRLALHEALTNAVRHGNASNPAAVARLRYAANQHEFSAEVEDQGPGFDPSGVPDPTLDENLERSGGRGLLLMRHYMTHVRYNLRGNCVTLTKRRGTAASGMASAR